MTLSEHEKQFAEPAVQLIMKRWPMVWSKISESSPSDRLTLSQTEPHPAFALDGIQLASSYDPEGEAQLQMFHIDVDSREVRVYGVAMGYLPRQLLAGLNKLEKLHVYIFNRSLFYALIHWIDQTDWLSDPRVELHIPRQETFPEQPYAVTTPCLWVADEEAFPLRDRIQADINTGFVDQEWRWMEKQLKRQLSENLEYIQQDGDVTELFAGNQNAPDTAIVAGAGPSLEQSIGKIHEKLDAGAVLVAVDAALRPLLANEIYPDIVVSIDPQENGVAPNFSGDLNGMENSVLVYFPVVHHDALKLWSNRRLVAYPEDDPLYRELQHEYPKGKLFANGSVIHPAIDLAVQAGVKTIYLAGTDFAFPNNKSHAEAVPHVEILEQSTEQVGGLTIKDGHGKLIPSKINMVSYMRDLEIYMRRHPTTRFVNLSREGAYIAGTLYED